MNPTTSRTGIAGRTRERMKAAMSSEQLYGRRMAGAKGLPILPCWSGSVGLRGTRRGAMRSADRVWLDQHVSRNIEKAAEGADHRQRQRAAAVQHLGDPCPATDRWLQVAPAEVLLFHHEQDRIYRVWRRYRGVCRFVGCDQCGQDIEPVAGGRARAGVHQAGDFGKGGLVVSFGPDRS